ncbi:MAG: substrate-binding domain-containing protein, partial [Rhodocyclaceae bacterium]|nr:substrate-binding domain-containing protein [Rhodocyclaceae bacterium]
MNARIIAACFAAAFALGASAAEVRLNGATTVLDRVVNPNKDAVEKATGHTLKLVGNATGRGLVDLVEGRCDASMASEPIPIAVEAAKAAGKAVDPKSLQMSVIRTDEIVFVVNKANPVTKLTHAQIKDIHLGRITN